MKNNEIETTAVSALAAASKTPFWTAFKITMGIATAQMLLLLFALGGCAAVITAVGYAVSK